MKLSTYIHRRLVEFESNLNIALQKNNEEAIHDLRVALKRVFALKKILNILVKDYKLSYAPRFEHIKTIFKISGKIRDYQLMIHAASERLPKKQFYSFKRTCNNEINQAAAELAGYLEQHPIKKIKRDIMMIFRSIDLLRPEYIISRTKDYISSNENLILQELNAPQCDYHKIRRWVKEQYYLMILLDEVFREKIDEQLKINKKETGSTLGNWHDLNVLYHHLSDSRIKVETQVLEDILSEANQLINNPKSSNTKP